MGQPPMTEQVATIVSSTRYLNLEILSTLREHLRVLSNVSTVDDGYNDHCLQRAVSRLS